MIEVGELRFVLEHLKEIGVDVSDGEIDDLLNDADTNQDGLVSYEEFMKLLTLKD